MRAIKFRIFDKNNKKFLDHEGAHNGYAVDLNGRIIAMNSRGHCYADNPLQPSLFEINQYTGLKDKNGQEIYERDIVKHNGIKTVVKIGWMAVDAFDVFGVNIWGHYDQFEDYGTGKRIQSEIEVIGNIYENPELIKENEK